MVDRTFERVISKPADDGRPFADYTIKCSSCGKKEIFRTAANNYLPDNVVCKKFKQLGWVIGPNYKKDQCPECSSQKKERKAMKAPQPAPLSHSLAKPTVPTPAAGQRITDLYIVLEDAYDRGARRYKPGFSDDTVAKDLNLSVVFVAARREQDFGPLASNTIELGIEAMGRQIDELSGEIADKSRRVSDLVAEIMVLAGTAKLMRNDVNALKEAAKAARV